MDFASNPDLLLRAQDIKLLLLDVDGVLTDGRLPHDADGGEMRTFHVRDGLGMKLAQSAGLAVGIISGRSTRATERRATELGLDELVQGQRRKLGPWREILQRRGLEEREVAFMGDDLIDLPLLDRAGLAAAPSDACAEALDAADWVSSIPGGAGCVREFIEAVLKAQGSWTELVLGLRDGKDN